MADLDLLVDYVNVLESGLEKAEESTRAGELGQAVWAYLAVLEVDPDNAVARRQVGEVATAVRQFDAAAPRRRWLNGGRGAGVPPAWLWLAAVALLVVAAFALGYGLASRSGSENQPPPADPPHKLEKPPNRLGQARSTRYAP